MILAFFKPFAFQFNSSLLVLNTLYDVYKGVVIIIVFCMFIASNYPTIKLSRGFLFIIFFGVWGILTTIINQGLVGRVLTDVVSIWALYMLVSCAMKMNSKIAIGQLTNVMLMLTTLQFASIMIFPRGIPVDLTRINPANPLYFVTTSNGTTALVALTMILIYIRDRSLSKKRRFLNFTLPIGICMLTAILSLSATAMITASLLLVLPFTLKFLDRKKHFDKPLFWITSYFGLTALVLFTGESTTIANILFYFTGRLGFTGRITLWERGIEMILRNPLLGYGRQSGGVIEIWGGYFSSHNVLLELMLQGGIILLILWVLSIWVNVKKANAIPDKTLKRIISISLFSLLVGMMMESNLYSSSLFIVLAIAHESSYLGELKT